MSALLTEFKMCEDWRHDPWGSCMGVWFQVADELHTRDAVPAAWLYRPPGGAADPREPENYWYETLADTSTDELTAFGNVLERYSEKLKTAKRDY